MKFALNVCTATKGKITDVYPMTYFPTLKEGKKKIFSEDFIYSIKRSMAINLKTQYYDADFEVTKREDLNTLTIVWKNEYKVCFTIVPIE